MGQAAGLPHTAPQRGERMHRTNTVLQHPFLRTADSLRQPGPPVAAAIVALGADVLTRAAPTGLIKVQIINTLHVAGDPDTGEVQTMDAQAIPVPASLAQVPSNVTQRSSMEARRGAGEDGDAIIFPGLPAPITRILKGCLAPAGHFRDKR